MQAARMREGKLMALFEDENEEKAQNTVTLPVSKWDRLNALAAVMTADKGKKVSMAKVIDVLTSAGEAVWAKERPDLAAKLPVAVEEVRRERLARTAPAKPEKAPRAGKRGGR